MKHIYAGLTLDLGHTAWFRELAGVPIFHRWARPGRTACGLEIYRDGCTVGIGIPTRHAVRFGRPCRRCWPALLTRPTLFARPPATRDTSQQLTAA